MKKREFEFITIRTFDTSPFAWLYRNRLVDAGFNAILVDEHFVSMYWLRSNAVGGIKVQIPAAQLPSYLEFANQETVRAPASVTVGYDCRACAPLRPKRLAFARRMGFASMLLLGFPIPWRYNVRCECEDSIDVLGE